MSSDNKKKYIPFRRKEIDKGENGKVEKSDVNGELSNKDDTVEIKNPFDIEDNKDVHGNNEKINDPFSDITVKEVIDKPKEVNNPFDIESETNAYDNTNDRKDYYDNEVTTKNQTGAVKYEHQQENSPSDQEVELEIDPNRTYFFVFGQARAGKSTMIQSLAYYLKAHAEGQIEDIASADKANHQKGTYLLDKMIENFKKGEFADETTSLRDEDLSSEINLKFRPDNYQKNEFPFCILEMAGEDLEKVKLGDFGRSGGILDKRINAYLEHPKCSMIFICVIDVDFPSESEDFIDKFLDYARKLGHAQNPVLVTINKWDKVEEEYADGKQYLEINAPIIYKKLHDPNRYFTFMPFSIGTGIDNKRFKNHKKEDAQKLFEWMYEVSIGESFRDFKTPSTLENLFASLKSIFKK